jgi:polysaccharide deacetylase 2 family uncharacterized protein YibQ
VISAAILLAVFVTVWVAVVDDPDGGHSVAVATIEDASPDATGSIAGSDTAQSGDAADASASAETLAVLMPPEIPLSSSAEPGLIEQSSFGPLPRVAPDGARPREAYARRAGIVGEGASAIVIVVGGLGLSQTGTQDAIAMLPEDVTLAFAPYGSSLQRWVDEARSEGHEVILQVPLEPRNYPQENPGEHTLLVSADGGANRQDLHWIMSRMTSYAGVMNYMGARFTSDERALVPFLGEIGERGLYYLDDGTSLASLTSAVGEALRVPVITADLVVDADRSPGAIQRELAALESMALTSGLAVGVASAFPESVDAIAGWIANAEARGLVIVPASAAIGH